MNDEPDPKLSWLENKAAGTFRNVHAGGNSDGSLHRCPCCEFKILPERGGYDICPVCFWEDDGHDDEDADLVRGGPNSSLSPTQARKNFVKFGACERKHTKHVRVPRPDER
jgi:hypothetical protein